MPPNSSSAVEQQGGPPTTLPPLLEPKLNCAATSGLNWLRRERLDRSQSPAGGQERGCR